MKESAAGKTIKTKKGDVRWQLFQQKLSEEEVAVLKAEAEGDSKLVGTPFSDSLDWSLQQLKLKRDDYDQLQAVSQDRNAKQHSVKSGDMAGAVAATKLLLQQMTADSDLYGASPAISILVKMCS
jgi:hypothetical protein